MHGLIASLLHEIISLSGMYNSGRLKFINVIYYEVNIYKYVTFVEAILLTTLIAENTPKQFQSHSNYTTQNYPK